MNVQLLRQAISAALKDHKDQTVTEAWAHIDGVLAPLDAMTIADLGKRLCAIPKPKVKAIRPPLPSSAVIVERYLAELLDAVADTGRFQAIVARAKADKAVKLPEATQLAIAFLRKESKIRTKGDAFKAIQQRQIADRRAEAKKTRIDDIF